MNIQNLKPFDCYLIELDRLYNSFYIADSEYKQGKWEIQWCDKNAVYYINNIQCNYESLKDIYSNYKKIHSKILKNYSNLNEYERNIFDTNKSLSDKVEKLLKEVELFLNDNNIFHIEKTTTL